MKNKRDDELFLRERAISDARISSELEGSQSTVATRGDQDAYVRGEISLTQLSERVRSRYGLA
ncbi:antitoxin VbhA family protein [Aurantimicrobium photophilum]|uniref:Antitoxin VbhA domain-containing protein n=1 Tax=Aurantimicrobium photophilum TaxID=1987356 RepID=A0A2Z3RV98_9MICO|nr:antitoxin VbhA family protein [Aurantimicrobium photophilum]AWR20769.1 hypothetical protein AURMO_00149 [Aurantimicrobium photophilum]